MERSYSSKNLQTNILQTVIKSNRRACKFPVYFNGRMFSGNLVYKIKPGISGEKEINLYTAKCITDNELFCSSARDENDPCEAKVLIPVPKWLIEAGYIGSLQRGEKIWIKMVVTYFFSEGKSRGEVLALSAEICSVSEEEAGAVLIEAAMLAFRWANRDYRNEASERELVESFLALFEIRIDRVDEASAAVDQYVQELYSVQEDVRILSLTYDFRQAKNLDHYGGKFPVVMAYNNTDIFASFHRAGLTCFYGDVIYLDSSEGYSKLPVRFRRQSFKVEIFFDNYEAASYLILACFEKSDDWETEKEFRYVYLRKDNDPKIVDVRAKKVLLPTFPDKDKFGFALTGLKNLAIDAHLDYGFYGYQDTTRKIVTLD